MKLRIMLALLLTTFLSGCGGSSDSTTSTTEKAELRWDETTTTWDNTKWK